MKNKKFIASIFTMLFFVILPSCSNSINQKLEDVELKWANLENQYQRRYDLCNNIMNSMKAYIVHEHSNRDLSEQQNHANQLMQTIMDSVDSLKSIKVDPTDGQALNNYIEAQNKLKDQMRIAINIAHEAYPDLRANENFFQLQSELEGVDTRIIVALKDYIYAVQEYNVSISMFPNSISAKMRGHKKRPLINISDTNKIPDIPEMFD